MLSAILAQSLMMVNLPYKNLVRRLEFKTGRLITYDHAILSYFYIVANRRRFYDRSRSNMNMVSNLERVIVKVSFIRLVWWSL